MRAAFAVNDGSARFKFMLPVSIAQSALADVVLVRSLDHSQDPLYNDRSADLSVLHHLGLQLEDHRPSMCDLRGVHR